MKVQSGAGKLAHALKQHWNAHIKPANETSVISAVTTKNFQKN